MANGYEDHDGKYVKAVRKVAPAQWTKLYESGDMNNMFTCLYNIPEGSGYRNESGGCPPNNNNIPHFVLSRADDIYFIANDVEILLTNREDSDEIDPSWIEPYNYGNSMCMVLFLIFHAQGVVERFIRSGKL